MIFADPKVGKSILSIQLAHALGTQTPFLGYSTLKKWKVLYVQGDLPAAEWAHQLSDDSKSSVKLNRLTPGWDTKVVVPGALADPRQIEELKRELLPYEFVILDALVSLFGGQETNSASVMTHQLNLIRQLAPNKPIWLIHHKRKGSAGVPDKTRTSAAGSFALTAGVTGLYDLSPLSLKVMGRVLSVELDLKRMPDATWAKGTTAQLI